MGNKNFKNIDEFAAARNRFHESHPDAPKTESIECLSLIMKREYAEQILRGEKPLEYRAYSDFYIKRLIDKEVSDYISAHINDEEVLTFCNDIRQVNKIHFHNYNNSWFLDVECTFNDAFSINKPDIEFLQNKYGVHDFDEDLQRLDAMGIPEDKRPWMFYFVCGNVIDTNLDAKPEDEQYVEICGGNVIVNPEMIKSSEENNEKSIITFRVSKEVFNDIASGKQRVFEKEIKANKISEYFKTDEKGDVIVKNGIPQFKWYDAIQFVNKDKSYMCLQNNADLVFMDPEYGDMISISQIDEDEIDYTDGVISYTLGDEVKPE